MNPRIEWSEASHEWLVHTRPVRRFPTLLEAEQFLIHRDDAKTERAS